MLGYGADETVAHDKMRRVWKTGVDRLNKMSKMDKKQLLAQAQSMPEGAGGAPSASQRTHAADAALSASASATAGQVRADQVQAHELCACVGGATSADVLASSVHSAGGEGRTDSGRSCGRGMTCQWLCLDAAQVNEGMPSLQLRIE